MKFMSSYQCQGWDYGRPLTKEMCFPSIQEVLELTREIVQRTGVKKLLIASDQDPMISKKFGNRIRLLFSKITGFKAISSDAQFSFSSPNKILSLSVLSAEGGSADARKR